MAKIGRNQKCPCGSGKKYKHCHGTFSASQKAQLPIFMQAQIRAKEAEEALRKQAEGYGKPVISAQQHGQQIVAVKNKIFSSDKWQFFTDFLIDHMKSVFRRSWAERMKRERVEHPLLNWLERMNEHARTMGKDGVVHSGGAPFVVALFKFAYALYLIAHHDEIPKPLLRRLRHPAEFRPAVVETFAVAAFVVAGYSIRMGETQKSNIPEAEFEATSADGSKVFAIEAKRKNGWVHARDIDSKEFENELGLWLKRKLFSCAKKSLKNPVYWLELSLPKASSFEEAEKIQMLVRKTLREAEDEIRIDGALPNPAYVFVTSHCFLAEGEKDDGLICMLEGFHIHMHARGDVVDIEEAMDERDRDRDVVWIVDCLQKVQQVPHRFDGVPDGLVDKEGKPISRLQIGNRIEITFPDTDPLRGLLTEIVTSGDRATVIVFDEVTMSYSSGEISLTEEEQAARDRYGDVIFGKPNSGKHLPEEDELALYDFFLEAYANTPREKLCELISNHPKSEAYKKLPTAQLRNRLCREYFKSAKEMSARRKAA